MSEKKRKTIVLCALALFAILMVALFFWAGKPLIRFISEPEKFRAWVEGRGIWGRLAFLGIVVLQVIVAIIPGEPMEIAAGYAFGVIEGTLLCLVGITLSSIVVFCLVRKWGVKAVEVFFPLEKINELKFLKDARRLNLIVFILFFIPGTPKDVMTYFVGLTKMRLSTWIGITFVARIPSVITSTIGGNALGLQDYQFAVLVFVATAILSGIGLLIYRRISQKA